MLSPVSPNSNFDPAEETGDGNSLTFGVLVPLLPASNYPELFEGDGITRASRTRRLQ